MGLTLIAALDQNVKSPDCFQDYRDQLEWSISVETMLFQRSMGQCRYEDLNDHDQLRHDPMFAMALENYRLLVHRWKSTLNRIEHCP